MITYYFYLVSGVKPCPLTHELMTSYMVIQFSASTKTGNDRNQFDVLPTFIVLVKFIEPTFIV